jgi:predicted nuclease of predicted toxin-antitoxin system
MSYPLLLDEMLQPDIAKQLAKRGYDVHAVVADPDLIALPDDRILDAAALDGRALVTANIKDFIQLDAVYKSVGRPHAGVIMLSAKTFPHDRSFVGAVVDSLDRLLADPTGIGPERVVFLCR